jgi:hypothetical protein
MANQRDLKAFVRYDGSGRVVAGSLVLRKKKPKVGKWQEILTYECCNLTTTTTTLDLRPRISSLACGPLLPYQEITIVNGTSICDPMIYITGDFSQVPQGPFYVNVGSTYRMFSPMGNQAYPMGNCETCGGGTTTSTTTVTPTTSTTSTSTSSSTTTTTTTQSSISAVISTSSCGSGTPITVNFVSGTSLCDAPVVISGDFSSAPEEFYIIYNGISKVFIKTSSTTAEGIGGVSNECVTC